MALLIECSESCVTPISRWHVAWSHISLLIITKKYFFFIKVKNSQESLYSNIYMRPNSYMKGGKWSQFSPFLLCSQDLYQVGSCSHKIKRLWLFTDEWITDGWPWKKSFWLVSEWANFHRIICQKVNNLYIHRSHTTDVSRLL